MYNNSNILLNVVSDEHNFYIPNNPNFIKKVNLDKSFEFYSDEDRHFTIVMLHEGKSIKYLDDSTYEVLDKSGKDIFTSFEHLCSFNRRNRNLTN